jgi:hypothetical protein
LAGKLEKCPECREIVQMPNVASLPDRQPSSFQPPRPPAPMPVAPVEETGNPYQSPATDSWSELRSRRMSQPARHGCLTAWLILMIVVNTLGAIVCLFRSFLAAQHHIEVPGWFIAVMLAAVLLNLACIVCAVALFRWKKWGFYGYLILKVIDIVGGMLLGNPSAAAGVLGIVILLGLLHMGGVNKAWHNLD